MKFNIVFFVKSKKEGLELLDEYERLNFPEEHRSNNFPGGQRSVDVPVEIARLLSDYFKMQSTLYLHIDSTLTTNNDWEDYGSSGMALKEIELSLNACKMLTKNVPFLEYENEIEDDDLYDRHLHTNNNEKADRSHIEKRKSTVRNGNKEALKKEEIKNNILDFSDKNELGRAILFDHKVKNIL